ncbi:hypothetical protein PALA52_05149 [Pseudomonas aeruginosa]|nr:hypothetical protein PALA52_05149 [Pseudomonas aeruginosa]
MGGGRRAPGELRAEAGVAAQRELWTLSEELTGVRFWSE